MLGDGTLVVFDAVAEAVRCAIALQTEVKATQDTVRDTDRLVIRIGINLSDVIIEGDDVFGDGVNVAARLQAIARPGGVCLADAVYRQVARKIEGTFENGGEVSLKNISVPLQIWHWEPPRRHRHRSRHQRPVVRTLRQRGAP